VSEHEHSVFSDKQFAQVEAYVHDIQRLVGLGNWKLHVTNHAPDKQDAYAQSDIGEVGMDCYLSFAQDFLELDPTQQRETILHEMMHMWLQHLFGDYELSLSHDAAVLLRRQAERVVDGLACAMAPLLPLPKWT